MDEFLSLFLVFFFFTMARAQSSTPQSNGEFSSYAKFSPAMAIIIVVLIAAFFFLGFFSIYIRHCTESSGAAGIVRQTLSMRNRRTAAARGLDASVIETFPTFTYSEVKDHKIGKGTLECAVCLNEFEDDETLRLIPKCDHVFHPECIGAWLESHVTCPVCRANLTPQASDEAVPGSDLVNNVNDNNAQIGDDIGRSNRSGNEEIVVQVEEDRPPIDRQPINRPQRSWSVKLGSFARFRSHSTGHSSVQNLERFTLRLPEDVRKDVINRAILNRAASFAVSSKSGGGEGSSRGGRSNRRIEKLGMGAKSDRWVFFTRVLSMKSPRVAAAAESGDGGARRIPVRRPSFNCLEPKAGPNDSTGPSASPV